MTLSPLTDAQWPAEIAHLRDGFAGSLNVYRTMANHPALLAAWTNLRDHVVVKSTLTPIQSEVAILRVGVRLGSDYEWAHHVVRARKCGMDDKRIATLRGGLEAMQPGDAAIAGAVDALLDNARLESKPFEEARSAVGDKGILDIMATVGFYSTLAFVLNTFEVPIDDDIKQALAEQPFSES